MRKEFYTMLKGDQCAASLDNVNKKSITLHARSALPAEIPRIDAIAIYEHQYARLIKD